MSVWTDYSTVIPLLSVWFLKNTCNNFKHERVVPFALLQ